MLVRLNIAGTSKPIEAIYIGLRHSLPGVVRKRC